MSRSKFFPIIAAAALFTLAGNLGAQETGVSSASSLKTPASGLETGPMLRVQLVITRFEGEKKLGSLPYTFVIAPNNPTGNMMRIRMGVDAPVPASAAADGAKDPAATQYRNIGTNIDCYNVKELPGGRYQFDVNLQNTTAIPGTDGDAKGSRPLLRRFDSNFTSVLRDGQSMQTIASTDPVTGEVVKIDVTLNVVR